MRLLARAANHLEIMTRSLSILLLALLVACSAAAADRPAPGNFLLGDGLRAELDAAGVFSILQDSVDGPRTVLRSAWPPPRAGRAAVHAPDVLTTACEGDPGGRRGFAASADDDGDGLVDEDRLDGLDNDGDGLVDEDFAAVGHAMVAWHRQRATWSRHIEASHWSYPSLQSLVAVTLDHAGSGLVDPWQLTLPVDATWLAVDRTCPESGEEAGGPVFLSELPADGAHPACWLGIVVLDTGARARSHERLRAEDGRLTIPFIDERLTLVVACGASRLQVVDDLLSAADLRDGMTDPVTGTSVAWLPRPDTLLSSDHGQAILRDHLGSGELRLDIADGDQADLDPDRLLNGDGQPLMVAGLVWEPATGTPRQLEWPGRLLSTSPLCHPHRLLEAEGPGTLALQLAGPLPLVGDVLTAHRVDGRPLLIDVLADPAAPAGPVDDPVVDDPSFYVRLAPGLLSNYPNPFRSTTSISFQVPATVGEAFDLSAPDAPDLDPARAMPYAAASPLVAVSVFTLEGRSVATLRSDRLGPGSYEASWDGRDDQGRAVPSGAYFCKLQIENWSVTKRLIFVR